MENEEIEIFKIFKDTRYNPNGALWEVSNLGNVRKNGKEFLPYEDGDKYLLICRNYKLHWAVAKLFVPNPDHKPTIDHINRIRTDNRASNLRWATYKEQAANRDNEAISKAQIGNKRALGHKSNGQLGKVWIFNPTTEHSTCISPSQLPEYLDKGYVRGREKKVWVFNPTTEHLTNINPSQLPEYLEKGYIRGRK